ncbi:monofunctional biosynthetic peptidoglycan transglycosylase [Marinomonas ostreistagni]|uniref:monofunctional biosynthetic peptidoglycan transglycosylase n=1 Tax=Marinomonas ostreistagni TaxID=359209 RepID=UPI0019512EEC|nr:monofunctional biosynthetic peptidoglycan transglycosylase [Marinomonas ostreistagni]MBM6550737.1 monofunctional biosynthetic peptidoglycan transglycosylase [Marinomonas ostreistagni]
MAKRRYPIFRWLWSVFWKLALLLVLLLILFRFVPPPTTAFMLQSDAPVTQSWVDLDELPDYVPLAFVASEDQRFPLHYGVDFTAISNALHDYGDGEQLRGASTITQQTAKNLFLWPGRSLIRKGLEASLAMSLELLWGKHRILEIYLNVAEFGPGIYGVEAASQHYFNRSARALTPRQAAQLAVLLPNPRQRNPNRLSYQLSQRVSWIERQMRQLGPQHLAAILE